MSTTKLVHVAVAAIERDGEVLLSKRPDHVHQGGLWEFPGGKVEPEESLGQALVRELQEELGIEVERHRPLIRVTHHYPDKSVLLDVHKVLVYSGEPSGCEGQSLGWVPLDKLEQYPMPAADKPIVDALHLPDNYLITGNNPQDSQQFLQSLGHALDAGIKLVQLRAPELSEQRYRQLATEAVGLCNEYGAELLLNAAPELTAEVGAQGTHLNRHRLMALTERPLPPECWVAASCHNLAELEQAERLGLDFVVLSPVLPTVSHPDGKALGWEHFEQLCQQISIPVYALGGVGSEHVEIAQTSGAQGVAGIRAFWSEH